MEDYGSAKGYIELDISDLESNVRSAVKHLDNLERKSALAQSELNRLESQSVKIGNVFQQASQRTKELSLHMDQAKQKCKLYDKEIDSLNTIIKNAQAKQKELSDEIEKATAKYERAEKKVSKMAEAHGKESEEYQKAVTSAQNAKNSLTQLQNEYDALGTEIEASGNHVLEFRAKLNNTQADVNRMSVELARAQSKAIQYGEAMQGVGDRVKSAGEAMGRAGTTLSMGVTTPVVAAGTAAVKLATDAETSFAKVSTIADETVLSYDKMKSEVTKASDETGVAISDFNEALYSSLSAGVESGKAIGFTTDMVQLARGGFTDTAKAVDVVTSVLNAYGLSADQASSISDKLITTQNIGKVTVDELAGSLGRVIPTAKAFNVGIDDVSTAMAIMTKRGIQTSEATTYYNSMLNELGSSGTKADKALRELSGKGFSELIAQGTPLTEILQLLSDTATEDGKSLSDMFGSMEAGKAALSIMSDGGAEYNQVLDQMKNSAGAAQEAFDKMNAAPAAKMQFELNKLKNAGVEAGVHLLPHITNLVEGVGDLAEKFSDLSPEEQKAIIKTAAFAAGMGPVLKVTGSVATGVGSLTKGFGSLLKIVGDTKALKASEAGMTGVGEAVEMAGGSTGMLSKVITGMTSPVGMLTVGVGALATSIVHTHNKIMEYKEVTAALTKEQQANIDAVNEATKVYEAAEENRQEAINSIGAEYAGYENLSSELRSITDKNGKVKSGYEDRAKVITGVLSQALGIEISMTDGIIENYQALQEEIDNVIQKQKAQAVLETYQKDIADAYANSSDALTRYNACKSEEAELSEKVKKAQEEYNDAKKEQLNSAGKNEEIQRQINERVAESEQALKNATKAYEDNAEAMNNAKDEFEGYQSQIEIFNSLTAALASGSAEEIEAALQQIQFSFKTASNSTKDELISQTTIFHQNLESIMDGSVTASKETTTEVANLAATSLAELSKLTGGIPAALESLGPEASGAIIDSLADADIKGLLSEESKGALDSFINGFDGLDAETQETFANAWYGALKGLEGYEDLADPAEEGVEAFLESLRSKLEVHSPSRAVERIFSQVWPGASNGLDDGQEGLTTKGTGIVDGFLAALLAALNAGIPGVAQVMGLIGSEGRGSMQTGLTGKGKLSAPGVFGIAGTTLKLGIAGNTSMGKGMLSKVLSAPGIKTITGEASRRGIEGNTSMGTGLRAASLTPPEIKALKAKSKAEEARRSMQGYFDNNPLSIVVNTVKKVTEKFFAEGGIATEPSIFGEDGPEMAIPLAPGKRDRAKALYAQTGRILGITQAESELRRTQMDNIAAYRMVSSGRQENEVSVVAASEIDYNLLADRIAQKLGDTLRKAPIQPIIQMKDGDVSLDNERVGRKLAPVISRILSQST